MPVLLESFLPHLIAWLMVLFRLTGIFVIAPVLGSKAIPGRIKILFAASMSFCLYPMLLNPDRPSAAMIAPILSGGVSLWLVGWQVAMELMVGTVIGYGSSLPVMGLQVAGNVADQQMGIGLGGLFNPELDEQGGVISEFYFIIAMMAFLIVDGHRMMLAALVGSFDTVPLGGFKIDGPVINLILGLLASMFDIGLRISAPLLCLVFLESVAMGFIARTLPQFNVLSIGFPLRLLAGGALMVVSVATIMTVCAENMRQSLRQIVSFFSG